MQIAGVEGECEDRDHKNWVDIEEWESGMTSPIGGTKGPAATEATLEEILIVKRLDKSSPMLMQECMKRSVIPEVVIDVCRVDTGGSSVGFYRYELKDDVPLEEISLNFSEIKVTYRVIDSEGKPGDTVEFSWGASEGKSTRKSAKKDKS